MLVADCLGMMAYMLVSGYWSLVTGCWLLVIGYWMLDILIINTDEYLSKPFQEKSSIHLVNLDVYSIHASARNR